MKPANVALAVLVTAVWGMNFPVGKAGVAELPPIFLMALRFSLVALMLAAIVRPPTAHLGRILALSVTLGTLHFSLMFTGLKGLPAGTAAIAIQLQVPFAALLAAAVFGDKLGWRRLFGMVVAFAGIALIAGEPRIAANPVPLALVVSASFMWAVANIQIKLMGEVDGFALNAWLALFAAPQLFVASFLLENGQLGALVAAGWRGYGAVVYMAVMVTVVGYGLWYHLLRHHPVNQTMPFTLLVPVFGVVFGVLLLGETLTWRTVVGGLLTLFGVSVIVLRRPRLPRPGA